MLINYCWSCGSKITPGEARCPSCGRVATIERWNSWFGPGFGIATLAWRLFQGLGLGQSLALAVAVGVAMDLFIRLFYSSPHALFTKGMNPAVLMKNFAATFLLMEAMIAGVIWPTGVEPGDDMTVDVLAMFVGFPAAMSLFVTLMIMVGFRGGMATCGKCGALISPRNNFCGTCGESTYS